MTWNITLRIRRWPKVSYFESQKFRLTSVQEFTGKKSCRSRKYFYFLLCSCALPNALKHSKI